MIGRFGVSNMGSQEAVEGDPYNPQYPGLEQGSYYSFRPQVQGYAPLPVEKVVMRSRTRSIGAGLLTAAATVAIVHGIYFTLDDHPVLIPMMNQVTIGIAILAYIGAAMAFSGRNFYLASAGPASLVLVMVWDFSMQYLCWCPHQPIAGFVLIPLIGLSWRFIYHSRSEFID